MTEQEWQKATDVGPMLVSLREQFRSHRTKRGRRKLQLFACALCHTASRNLIAPSIALTVLELAWQVADGQLKAEEAKRAYFAVGAALLKHPGLKGKNWDQEQAVWNAGLSEALFIAITGKFNGRDVYLERAAPAMVTSPNTVILLRHIFGNPFQPFKAPRSWPAPVRELARAAYNQEPCHFALHDALVDVGQTELAEHFKESNHPRGCWALDVILS